MLLKNIEIIKEIDFGLAIYTDCALLEKACKNIVHNAVMYSPHNEKVYIKLSEDSKQSQIEMQIINTGVNIKDEDLQQILNHFIELKNQEIEILEEVVWGYILLNKFLKR